MISDTMYNMINAQAAKEFFSAYLYLNMAAWCDGNDLPGTAHWLKMQAQEELCHGQIMYNYMIDQNRIPVLAGFEAPRADYADVTDVFKAGLEHERFTVTKAIHGLADQALDERDHATNEFLQWFIKEQVEEEASFEHVLGKLKYVDPTSPQMLIFDNEMGARVFAMPSPLAAAGGV